MPFYVHAQDRPGIATELLDLAEAHWSYMDRFDDRLILRGPTLSDDGTEHTGSVHVVDLDDRAGAERFATEEPYWLAGLYGHLTTARTVVLLQREPTGSPLTSEPDALTLITGQWTPEPRNADDTGETGQLPGVGPDSRLSFVAVLVDDNQSRTTGIVSVVQALPDEALKTVQPLADRLAGEPVALTAQRWCRGGRS
ncbi:YciI family protein [Streptomyces sp. NPDC058572]|uniref:YciI family protein n=1 Tax=Streptomyces sp. NPDC058572 TaxID=3346546 RepID=UPI003661F85A